jgi:hypothetical protein
LKLDGIALLPQNGTMSASTLGLSELRGKQIGSSRFTQLRPQNRGAVLPELLLSFERSPFPRYSTVYRRCFQQHP